MAEPRKPKVRQHKKTNKKKVKKNARVEKDQVIAYDYKGIKLSKAERNERMKIEYIRGMSIDEIAHRYGLSHQAVAQIRSAEKWVKLKKQFDQDKKLVTDDTLTQMYAGFKVNVNIKYHAAWEKLMNIVEMALDNPDQYLFNDKGQPKWMVIDLLANIIDKAQNGQEKANGSLPAEVRYKLEIEKEKLTLLRSKVGEGEGVDELKDNFVEALDNATKAVWGEFAQTTGTYLKDHAESEGSK